MKLYAPESSSMELSSSSGVVALELMSALSSQLSAGPGPLPTGEGSSTWKPSYFKISSMIWNLIRFTCILFWDSVGEGVRDGWVSSTCSTTGLFSFASAGSSAAAGGSQEGTKTEAFTLGTNEGAWTLRSDNLLEMLAVSTSSSQLSGAPLVAIFAAKRFWGVKNASLVRGAGPSWGRLWSIGGGVNCRPCTRTSQNFWKRKLFRHNAEISGNRTYICSFSNSPQLTYFKHFT